MSLPNLFHEIGIDLIVIIHERLLMMKNLKKISILTLAGLAKQTKTESSLIRIFIYLQNELTSLRLAEYLGGGG